MTCEYEEEIVGIVMRVPHELPLRFHDYNSMAMKLGNSFRRPQLTARRCKAANVLQT